MSDVEIRMEGLEKLIKAMKKDPPKIRVGILGSSSARSDSGPNNATIGAKHEFDTSKNRSFLRIPLIENLDDYLKKSGAFDKNAMQEVVASGSMLAWAKKVAIVAETVVLDGFDSGGFGKWTPSDMRYKKNAQTLVETGQLRNAITSEVKD